ncbi:hypothetical protein [Shigella boydii]|uniref:hypothetical protein n=1 Tax=Shigella boydii TaxID=621 RepID=UPI0025416F41|nr:hypothetical protein [Shigella boydii]
MTEKRWLRFSIALVSVVSVARRPHHFFRLPGTEILRCGWRWLLSAITGGDTCLEFCGFSILWLHRKGVKCGL